MRNPRGIIFAGAISALVIMTVLSTVIGFALPQLLPKAYTHIRWGLLHTLGISCSVKLMDARMVRVAPMTRMKN